MTIALTHLYVDHFILVFVTDLYQDMVRPQKRFKP